MKLLKIFNDSFLNVLSILHRSFGDMCELDLEFKTVNNKLQEDIYRADIHEEFVRDVPQTVLDDIFNEVSDVISSNIIGFLTRSNMSVIYDRMEDSEKKVLWKNLQALCRYSSMVRACGSQLEDMESLATDFIQKNDGCTSDNYHMKLFHEMLSGGEMSQKLMSTFNNSDSIHNILQNVGNVMKCVDDNDTLTDIIELATERLEDTVTD